MRGVPAPIISAMAVLGLFTATPAAAAHEELERSRPEPVALSDR
jgi:methionine-rich copper-binding protein CopC